MAPTTRTMQKVIKQLSINTEYDEIVKQFLQAVDIEQVREVAAGMVECSSSTHCLIAVINAGRKQNAVWKTEYPEENGASTTDNAAKIESSFLDESASPPPVLPKPRRKVNRTRDGKVRKPIPPSRSKRKGLETFAEVLVSRESSLRAPSPSIQSTPPIDRPEDVGDQDVVVITSSPPPGIPLREATSPSDPVTSVTPTAPALLVDVDRSAAVPVPAFLIPAPPDQARGLYPARPIRFMAPHLRVDSIFASSRALSSWASCSWPASCELLQQEAAPFGSAVPASLDNSTQRPETSHSMYPGPVAQGRQMSAPFAALPSAQYQRPIWHAGGIQHHIPSRVQRRPSAVPHGLPELRTEGMQHRDPSMALRVASAVPHDVPDSRPEGSQPLETPNVPAPPVPKYPPMSQNPSNGSGSNLQSVLPGMVQLDAPAPTQPTTPSGSTPAASKSTLGCSTVGIYMRVPPSLSGSDQTTYEPLAGFLRTFQDKIITRLRNDYVQCQHFHKGCNLLFMDTNKHFISDDCASSLLKKQDHHRFDYTKDRYACEDCMRANQFCVRLYKQDGENKWGLAVMPLPPTEDPVIGKSKYNMECWIVGSSGQSSEKKKKQERADEERGVEKSPCVRPGGSHTIYPDPDGVPSDGGMIAIPNEDVNGIEDEDNGIAETAAPTNLVDDEEHGDDDQLGLIDPSDGDETDIDPFDKDLAPSDDDGDEEVDERAEYDPLDYDLPDFDDI